ncbi:MAG: hypothetical protein HY319_29775 [Armatimonadetes bacterium]|nr:hypothetical protein [Armatimonadota bacterium]
MRILSLLLLLSTSCLAVDTEAFSLVPGVSVGPLGAGCRPQDVEPALAPLGLRPEDIFAGTLGAAPDTEPSTELWPADPARRLNLVWSRKRSDRLVKAVLFGQSSLWKTPEGISLGTPLSELERLNGKPFLFRSFDLEEGSGQVVDWQGGRLERHREGMVLALSLKVPGYSGLSSEEKVALEQPGTFRSNQPTIRKLNPVVERLEVLLNPE